MDNATRTIPQTTFRHLGEVFFRRVEELGDQTCIKLQRRGRLETVSWRAFGGQVRDLVLGLDSIGLEKGAKVAIISENRIEWLCADIASLAAGLPNVIISPSLSDGPILKLLAHSRARAVFVEDATCMQRLLSHKAEIPDVECIIVMKPADDLPSVEIQMDELLERGSSIGRDRLAAILNRVHPDDLATIVYTSGSTGEPKGVMRTQRNILSNYTSSNGDIALSSPADLTVLVLSLNHLYGRFVFHRSIATGRTTAVVEATEKEFDLEIIRTLSPTSMSLVPRVMEKIWEQILARDRIRERWEGLDELYSKNNESRNLSAAPLGAEYESLRIALRESARDLLGGRIKYVSYGGAPMPPTIMLFFQIIGIPLLGGYGSTECGGVTVSGLDEVDPGSLGKPFPNVEVCIAADGEILVRGPTVSPGYYENPEATREAFDADGWFHTGDLGEISSNGCLRIVGRKKDVFNCSDGSNIYPQQIEVLLENDPSIREAVLIGDRRPFIAALIVPNRARIAAELKVEETSLNDSDIEEILWSRVETINDGLEHFEKVRKITVLQDSFPSRVMRVTAFQKIKVDRKAVEEEYQAVIQQIYGPGN